MKCPACPADLVTTNAGSVEVDICSGCGGAWLDHDEIKKFDEPHEIEAQVMLDAKKKDGITFKPFPRKCPRCSDAILVRQYFGTKDKVQIDLCWTCGGVFLDTGELAQIRGQFKTEAERQKAGDDFLRHALDQHEKAMKLSTKQQIAKMNEAYADPFKSLLSGLRALFFPSEEI